MRFIIIAALTTALAAPAYAQGQSGYPANAGAGNSNTTSSATADAPLANPNDEHSDKIATQSSTDAARKVENDARANHPTDQTTSPPKDESEQTGASSTAR
ncbi:MAG TPA: hypothetical protein VGM26_06300 [Rhizomicrobium sp.]|jgi:hypothetical protein